MKAYNVTLRHDAGEVTLMIRADNYQAAQQRACTIEGAPLSAVKSWAVVPTTRQIRRTKNLLRCL
jgi:hypothetical protein